MQYNIPKEISTEMKFTSKIYLFDFAMLLVALIFATIFSGLGYPSLRVLFYIFVAISTIFLVNKSIINPKKRNFQTVYLALVRDKKVYVAEKVE